MNKMLLRAKNTLDTRQSSCVRAVINMLLQTVNLYTHIAVTDLTCRMLDYNCPALLLPCLNGEALHRRRYVLACQWYLAAVQVIIVNVAQLCLHGQ